RGLAHSFSTGLLDAFDAWLVVNLLTEQEGRTHQDLFSKYKPRDVYGAEHLLRFFTRLADYRALGWRDSQVRNPHSDVILK
ncbi:hypothetical protein KIPB_017256, partial [Kipferlia bialata]